MPVRARVLALAAIFVATVSAGVLPAVRPSPVAAAGPKVAIIVGPVGSMTSSYRSSANRVANAAAAAGATVVKAYSPRATWSKVKAAVNGANVIVYFGHGNGYPNPYSSTENTDRVNGWGLNRTTSHGDSDNWSTTMVYCGEDALLGKLTSSDGAAQRKFCASGAITPAPGFTMVYAQAHYAPGFGERYKKSDPLTTLGQARQRVKNYSTPVLRLGGSYFATAYGDAHRIVSRLLSQPNSSYGDIFRAGEGYRAARLDVTAHPDVAGAKVFVQRTRISGLHFGDPDYWYAFAGNPKRTVGGGSSSGSAFSDIGGSKFASAITWVYQQGIMAGCTSTRFCPDAELTRGQLASALANGLNLPAATTDYYHDDTGSPHEADINRLREAGLTGGCGDGNYCPGRIVRRGGLASALAVALNLPATTTNFFVDDNDSPHQANINRIAAAGISSGCGGDNYCPDSRVKRAQAAAFLRNAFD